MIKKIVLTTMSIILGMAPVRAQEIPDSVKVKVPEAIAAACDTVKVRLDSLGVTAAADSLRAACDTLIAPPPTGIQPADATAQGGTGKADAKAVKDGAGKEDAKAVKDGAGKEDAKEQEENKKVDLTEYTVKETEAEKPEEKGKDKRKTISHAGLTYISIQGGAAFNYYENSFLYSENGQIGKMFTPQGALSIGYDFSDDLGARLQVAYGNNAGACNNRETSSRGFYPYNFQSVNLFLDGMLNLAGQNGENASFRPKLYLGAGVAHTFAFTDPGHPWQKLTEPNTVFGFRTGFLAEYCWRSGFGIFADLCAEAYTDSYNGLHPSESDQAKGPGYAGFPLDVRGVASFGIVFHF